MAFFETVDSLGIVEGHIKRVLKLEDNEARTLLRKYREVRRDLRDRLDRMPEGTFSNQQMRGVMTQVDAAIIAMTRSLAGGIKDSSTAFAIIGVKDSIAELEKFEKRFTGAVTPININRQLVAANVSNFLINRHDSSIEAYSADVRGQLVRNLTNEMLMQSSNSAVVQKLGQFFNGEEWKLQRIARTEFHNIYSQSKLESFKGVKESALPKLMKALIHPMDGRTGDDSKKVNALNLVAELDEPFRYKWQGKVREFMTPPDRPNDRSVLVPFEKSWNN